MRASRLFSLTLVALAAPLLAMGASAQTAMVQPIDPAADELAAQMRLLAANPQDLQALIRAGELTLKLDDPTAAATFFAHAEKIDPRNARIKAGLGSLLVQAEKPGEALRRFAEAESFGLAPQHFAADRGLAYDLIGDQARAQRDYRLALLSGPDDETSRRYALSLGISGKADLAYSQLEPLLRRSDRGAWRARAFILAMSGDNRGAERIAVNMMPPGLAQGLQPFFDRLAGLGPVDRAFAVHFGELRATPERIADARMIPSFPPLPADGAEPRPVVASAAPPAPTAPDDRRKRKNKHGAPAEQAARTPPPEPLPQPPTYVASVESDTVQPYKPAYGQPVAGRQTMTLAPAQPGFASGSPAPALADALPPRAPRREVIEPARQSDGSLALTPAPQPLRKVELAMDSRLPASATASTGLAPSIPSPSTPPSKPAPAPVAGESTRAQVEPSVADGSLMVAQASTSPATPAPPPTPLAPPTGKTATPMRSEDSILANIIAGISVPKSELTDTPSQEESAPAPVEPARAVRAEPAARAPVITVPVAAEKAATEKQKLADKKASDAKKAADAKKLADAKKAAELKKKNDPKILEPARFWVQVAGGANEAALAKEWARVRAAQPALFKGKTGWTTPLRATNRVLTGPFNTSEEARDFVNQVAKAGLPAFAFTSEAGQKITKLTAR